MNHSNLLKNIVKVSKLTNGNFVLKSGQVSSEYFDKYQFEADPKLLDEICGHIYLNLFPDNIDVIAGLELGGIAIATILSSTINLPLSFVRKEVKTYGTCQLVEGANVVGQNVLVVEDIITTGSQVIKSVNHLRDLGAIVNDAICVIDRENGGKQALQSIGVELNSLFTKSEIDSL